MDNKDKSLENEQREYLRMFLSQYLRSKSRKRQLERQLMEIRNELEAPIGGVGYSPTPRSVTNKIGTGSASITFKMADIEERILEQKDRLASAMLTVMNVLDYLEADSVEREILEYKFISGDSIGKISKEVSFSRSQCYNYMNQGLDQLLTFKKVDKMIEDYRMEIECDE